MLPVNPASFSHVAYFSCPFSLSWIRDSAPLYPLNGAHPRPFRIKDVGCSMKVTSEHTAADKVDCQISFVWQHFGTLSPGAPAQLGNGHWSLRLASDSASSWAPSLPLQPPPLYPGSNYSNPHLSKKKNLTYFYFLEVFQLFYGLIEVHKTTHI